MKATTAKQRSVTRFDVVRHDGKVLLDCVSKPVAEGYREAHNSFHPKARAKLVRVKWMPVEQ